jgi:hypothetical protein
MVAAVLWFKTYRGRGRQGNENENKTEIVRRWERDEKKNHSRSGIHAGWHSLRYTYWRIEWIAGSSFPTGLISFPRGN